MTSSADGRAVHGDGAPGRTAVARADEERDPGVLQVTVAGADPLQLRRLVRLLDSTEGLEVVGWGEPAGPSGVDGGDGAVVVALHEPAGEHPGAADVVLHAVRPGDGEPAAEPLRPALSARQQEVLAAYGASNDLVDVVARGLGMNRETLKTHLRRIRGKYRDAGRPAPTRRDLYVRAVEDGLLPPPG
jgi:DNA-binding CsgD family transcriptional regulator